MGGDNDEQGREILDILYATEEGFAVPDDPDDDDVGYWSSALATIFKFCIPISIISIYPVVEFDTSIKFYFVLELRMNLWMCLNFLHFFIADPFLLDFAFFLKLQNLKMYLNFFHLFLLT